MIKVIEEKEKWDATIGAFDHVDFYHTFDYHLLSKKENEYPILLLYKEKDFQIALPLLVREIEGTPYKDATSVYGYAGPLYTGFSEKLDNSSFEDKLSDYLLKNNFVSVFSRLNPFIPLQEQCLFNLGKIASLGKIVNIDLTKDLDSQWHDYHRRLRTYVNKSRNQCEIREAQGEDDILQFMELYYENMRRINATDFYFFDKEYFFDLMNSQSFKTQILFAVHKETGEVVAGAQFVKTKNIVQYHLCGSKEAFLHLNPIKLLIDEMRVRATKENFTYFNLGGGKSGHEDSLFQFKSGFSKDYPVFKVWQYIVNTEIYDKLVNEVQQHISIEEIEKYEEFFPSYRINFQH